MAKTILVLAANPKNTPSLRLEQEVREIGNGLERAKKRDEFTLKQKFAARPVDVRRAMLDYEPSIVHFCGHGSDDEGIVFEDQDGQAKFIDTPALSGFFELFANKVECVVLNACYSEIQAAAIARHIPFVIGMKRAIGDNAAIEFATAFYDAIGAGESIEFAYKLGCNAIQWEGLPDHLTPVLIQDISIANRIPASLQEIPFPKSNYFKEFHAIAQGENKGVICWAKSSFPNSDLSTTQHRNPPQAVIGFLILVLNTSKTIFKVTASKSRLVLKSGDLLSAFEGENWDGFMWLGPKMFELNGKDCSLDKLDSVTVKNSDYCLFEVSFPMGKKFKQFEAIALVKEIEVSVTTLQSNEESVVTLKLF